MKPKIDKTKFGAITIAGKKYENDVIIRLDGSVKKRKKKLSKAVYGALHTISLDEARYVYDPGARRRNPGSGSNGRRPPLRRGRRLPGGAGLRGGSAAHTRGDQIVERCQRRVRDRAIPRDLLTG